MVLAQTTCDQIASKLGCTIKHKLGLASTTPNNALYNPLEYGFFHIWERQLLHHSSNWTQRIMASNHAGIMARIRAQETQNIYWSTNLFTSLHLDTPFIKKGNNLTHDIILVLRQHGFTFNIPKLIPIKRVATTIQEITSPTWYQRHRAQLKKNNILFISQCLNARNTKLLAWPEVTSPLKAPNRKQLSWFTDIENLLLNTSQQRLSRIVYTTPSENIFHRYIESIHLQTHQIKWIATKVNSQIVIGKKKQNKLHH
jgi:hypothetical protein